MCCPKEDFVCKTCCLSSDKPAWAQAPDGPAACAAVAERARNAAGLLRAALAGLAEAAESRHVRQVS